MTPQLHPHRSSSYTDEELWSQQFSASLALTVPELVHDAAGGLISSPGSVRWLVGCSWTTTTPKAQPGHPQNPQPLPKVTAVPCVQSSHAGQHGAQLVHWRHTRHSHRLFAFKGTGNLLPLPWPSEQGQSLCLISCPHRTAIHFIPTSTVLLNMV